ncbi:MAG: thioredoxin family protein [Terriglobales bacterium]
MRILLRLLITCCVLAPLLPAQQLPPGLMATVERWKAAVTNGDAALIQSLYSVNPPVQVVSFNGKQQLPISAEADFWQQTRASGMIGPELKILASEEKQGSVMAKMEFSFRTMTPTGTRQRYVIEQQVWQPQSGGWRMVLAAHSPLLKMRPVSKLSPHLYEKGADAKAEIRQALAKAAATHKRVLLVFGGNWCYDCHVLDAAFHEPDIAPVLNKNFLVVHVDVGQYDKNLDLGQKYQVPLDKGVPALAVLAPDGSLLYSQQHGEFEAARSMDPDDVIAFLNKWKPAAAR